MRAPVIRISISRFDVKIAPKIEAKLLESREKLEPGVRALKGNLGFFFGIDHEHGAMQNVSIWETVADAKQLDTFEPMRKLGVEFSQIGVNFDHPVMNYDTVWQFD